VHVNLFLKPDAVPKTVKEEVENRLSQFLNLQVWPFGRNVYVSEIYRLLDRIPGVDFVTKINNKEIIAALEGGDRAIKQAGDLVAIKLDKDELAQVNVDKSDIIFPNINTRRDP
jgi:hypothetical protein